MRKLKINTILVSQPAPESGKSPYDDIVSKYSVKVDFRPFIHVEGVPVQEFRKERIDVASHTAVILTSRYAVEHYFRMCKEMRFTVPESMKYYCISEATAKYLNHFIVYRKRKIFHGEKSFKDLIDVIKKFKEEKFLLPCSDIHKDDIPKILEELGVSYTKAVIYRTVCSDLSDLKDIKYDMLVFYSPSGLKSLFENFPDFKQNNTRIAAFGSSTGQAVREAGLILDIEAPMPNAPSMPMAIDAYIKSVSD